MIREARQLVADTLKPLGVAVSAYPPPTSVPPCVLILPGSPYRESHALTTTRLRFELNVIVNATSGADSAATLDDLLDQTFALLRAAGVQLEDTWVERPESVDPGLLQASIPIVVPWQE